MADLVTAKTINLCGRCRKYSDPLSVVSRMYAGHFIRDRFDILNYYSPFRVASGADEIPVAKDGSLADLVDARAQELIAQDKPIVVLWSGGVDSTAISTALLRNGVDLDKFTLAFAPAAIEEHPTYYKLMQDMGVTLVQHDEIPEYADSLSDCITLTGRGCDQLFTSFIHRNNPELYNKPWVEGMKGMMALKGINLTDRSYEVLEEVYSGYAEKLGLKLDQFCEFAWMVSFALKWQDSCDTFRLMCFKKSARDCVVNFFETYDFQCWAMAQYEGLRDANYIGDHSKYKTPLKQYLYEFDKDEAYLKNKGKVESKWSADAKKSRTYDMVFVQDTDGYHAYRDATAYPNRDRIMQVILHDFLKEEFQE